MFVVQIKEMLHEKGVLKPYAQLVKMGVPQTRAQNLIKGTCKNIYLSDLYKFCTYLNCTPKELLKVVVPSNSTSLDNHPLKEWVKKEDINLIKELIDLNPNEMEQVKDFLKTIKSKDL
jgi:DNA-binding Xre family transcriptional regulator